MTHFCVCVFLLFFSPLLHAFQRGQNSLFMYYLTLFTHCFGTVHGTHSHFIQKKNIKNGSYGTIHTFKNYFATVFSIFSKISCIQMNPKLFKHFEHWFVQGAFLGLCARLCLACCSVGLDYDF